MDELPIARGLVICERVDRDPRTRRLTLVNRMVGVRVRQFPTPPMTLTVFAGLANGFGSIPVRLVIEHMESGETQLEYQDAVEFADRLIEVPYLARLRDFVFRSAGTYECTLFAGGEPLAVQRLCLTALDGGRP